MKQLIRGPSIAVALVAVSLWAGVAPAVGSSGGAAPAENHEAVAGEYLVSFTPGTGAAERA
ncbi:MAG: hypothetical protein ACRDT4_26880, partial [Micromonosporaceae bacterium]